MRRLVALLAVLAILWPAVAAGQAGGRAKRPPGKRPPRKQPGKARPAKKRPPKKAPPADEWPDGEGAEGGEEGAEEEQKPPIKTVKLSMRCDRLILTDGKVLEGPIVIAGTKAVVIITADGEQTVPRSKVERIERSRAAAATLLPQTYETEVVDGKHEQIVVPVGLDDEAGEGPRGLLRPLDRFPAEDAATLRYKFARNDVIVNTVKMITTEKEKLPDRGQLERSEQIQMVIRQTVTDVAAAGASTMKATYELQNLVRGYVNVKALEAKNFAAVQVVRSVSPAGVWKPAADRITGAARDRRFAHWLGYVHVPVPEGPAAFGKTVKLGDVVSPELAAAMLPLPRHVSVPNWAVTGTYTVSGTVKVEDVKCAIITITLKGTGGGDGLYDRTRVPLDVQAQGRWDVYFAIAAGRPLHCVAQATIRTTGKIGDEPLECETTRTVTAALAGPAPPLKKPAPEKPADPKKGVAPVGPAKKENLNKALDGFIKKARDPKFFENLMENKGN